jgi:poly-gamma-glutamate synthesis protein (capsule biosynthesis protein)
VIASGDSLIFQKISIFDEKEFLFLKEIIGEADVAFTNFETIMPNLKGYPRYKRGRPIYLMSPEFVLSDLRWMGFNLFSLANNHAMDYSEGGLIETLRVFKDLGVTHAGAGRNLSEARAPAYLNTKAARIALIAINTGDNDDPAGMAWGSIPGRPGVNPLRYSRKILLKEAEFKSLAGIAGKLGLVSSNEDRFDFFGSVVELSGENNIITETYEPDLKGNLNSISEARNNSDFVLVSIHNHLKRRPGYRYFDENSQFSPEFVEEFSRAAIDKGADAVIGTGTHTLNGIEIYDGRPIFYGLGNFISQSYQSNPKPHDWYEARGFPEQSYPDDYIFTFDPFPTEKEEAEKVRRLTTSVISKIIFEKGRILEISLYPIEIRKNEIQGGRPFLTRGDNAEEILIRLSKLSAEYGTKIKIENGIGKIIL